MGFLHKAGYSYHRNIQSGNHSFYFIFSKMEDGIYIEPQCVIRFNEIPDIYYLVATQGKKYFKYSAGL